MADTPVKINEDGSVTAHGRKAWIWCSDDETGARFDLAAHLLPKQGVTPVAGYPVNTGRFAREAKSRTQLPAGGAAAAAGAALVGESGPSDGATPAEGAAGGGEQQVEKDAGAEAGATPRRSRR